LDEKARLKQLQDEREQKRVAQVNTLSTPHRKAKQTISFHVPQLLKKIERSDMLGGEQMKRLLTVLERNPFPSEFRRGAWKPVAKMFIDTMMELNDLYSKYPGGRSFKDSRGKVLKTHEWRNLYREKFDGTSDTDPTKVIIDAVDGYYIPMEESIRKARAHIPKIPDKVKHPLPTEKPQKRPQKRPRPGSEAYEPDSEPSESDESDVTTRYEQPKRKRKIPTTIRYEKPKPIGRLAPPQRLAQATVQYVKAPDRRSAKAPWYINNVKPLVADLKEWGKIAKNKAKYTANMKTDLGRAALAKLWRPLFNKHHVDPSTFTVEGSDGFLRLGPSALFDRLGVVFPKSSWTKLRGKVRKPWQDKFEQDLLKKINELQPAAPGSSPLPQEQPFPEMQLPRGRGLAKEKPKPSPPPEEKPKPSPPPEEKGIAQKDYDFSTPYEMDDLQIRIDTALYQFSLPGWYQGGTQIVRVSGKQMFRFMSDETIWLKEFQKTGWHIDTNTFKTWFASEMKDMNPRLYSKEKQPAKYAYDVFFASLQKQISEWIHDQTNEVIAVDPPLLDYWVADTINRRADKTTHHNAPPCQRK